MTGRESLIVITCLIGMSICFFMQRASVADMKPNPAAPLNLRDPFVWTHENVMRLQDAMNFLSNADKQTSNAVAQGFVDVYGQLKVINDKLGIKHEQKEGQQGKAEGK